MSNPRCPRLPTLHCACYDASYTLSSLSGLWALQEVHKLLVSSPICFFVLCISSVSLKMKKLLHSNSKTDMCDHFASQWTTGMRIEKVCKNKITHCFHPFHLNIYKIINADMYITKRYNASFLAHYNVKIHLYCQVWYMSWCKLYNKMTLTAKTMSIKWHMVVKCVFSLCLCNQLASHLNSVNKYTTSQINHKFKYWQW